MGDTKDFTVRMIIQPIIEQIENISKPIEETFERGTKKLVEGLESASASFDKEFTSLIGKLNSEMENSFKQTSRGMKDIQGTLTGGIEEIFMGISKGGAGGGIGGMLAGGMESLVGMVSSITPELLILIGIMLAVLAVLEPIGEGIGMIIKIITMPLKILGVMLLQRMGPIFDIAIKLSALMLKFFEGFGAKFDELYSEFIAESPENPIAASVGAFTGAFTEMFIEPLLHGFVDVIVGLASVLVDVVSELLIVLMQGLAIYLGSMLGISYDMDGFAAIVRGRATELKESFVSFGSVMHTQADRLSEDMAAAAFSVSLFVTDVMNQAFFDQFTKTDTSMENLQSAAEGASGALMELQTQMEDSRKEMLIEGAIVETPGGPVSVAPGWEQTVAGGKGKMEVDQLPELNNNIRSLSINIGDNRTSLEILTQQMQIVGVLAGSGTSGLNALGALPISG